MMATISVGLIEKVKGWISVLDTLSWRRVGRRVWTPGGGGLLQGSIQNTVTQIS